MKTRWIVCDLGKVLVDFDHASIARRLDALVASRFPERESPSLEALMEFLFRPRGDACSFNTRLDRGEATLAEVADAFGQQFDLPLPAGEIECVWKAIFRESNPAMIRFLLEARRRGARLALCSNTNKPHWDYIVSTYPELDLRWDRLFLSFQMGAAKTEPGFFERLVEETGDAPETHFFIDDLSENVEAAQAAGMRAFLFRGKPPALEAAGLS